MSTLGALLLLFSGILILFPLQTYPEVGIGLLALMIIFVMLTRLTWGMYLISAVSFFHGWEIAFANQDWAKNIWYLASLNAPLVDFIAVFVFGVLSLAIALRLHPVSKKVLNTLKWPTIGYSLFLLTALVSVRFAYDHEVMWSLKYFFRALVFVYLMFVIAPVLLIETKEILLQTLRIWFWVGIIIAVFGLTSLFVVSATGLPQVTPYGIGSFAPLGYNHNLLAEALVAIIPIGVFFSFRSKVDKLYLWGTFLMIFVALLTLSRAAWFAIALECALGIGLFYQQFRLWLRRQPPVVFPAIVIGLTVILYFGVFLLSRATTSSTEARLDMTRIVLFYTADSPFIGYGPGMYTEIFGNTALYRLEYGDVLDAHGFIQKILLEEGTVGLMFFCFAIALIAYQVFRSFKISSSSDTLLFAMLFVMILGEVFFQIFNTSYFNSVLWLPLGVALAATKFSKTT
jgi:O-antigen ligase